MFAVAFGSLGHEFFCKWNMMKILRNFLQYFTVDFFGAAIFRSFEPRWFLENYYSHEELCSFVTSTNKPARCRLSPSYRTQIPSLVNFHLCYHTLLTPVKKHGPLIVKIGTKESNRGWVSASMLVRKRKHFLKQKIPGDKMAWLLLAANKGRKPGK